MNEKVIPGPPTEAKLRQSEERFRVLSSVATEGVMIHEDHVVLDANQAFLDLLGLSNLEDLVGRNGMELISFTPESRRRVQDHMKSGSTATYDIEIFRPDGTIVPAETHGRDIEYLGRQARLVYMRDISERKRANEALRESERNYRQIFNAANDALLIHDESGHIVDVNERMCTLYRCDRESALGRTIDDLSLGESPYSGLEALERLRESETMGSHTFVWRSRRLNGELFWSEVALRPCVIGGQNRVIASVRDISDRKEAEDALASEKRFAEAVFESLPGVAYVYDKDGYLTRCNRNYEVVTRRRREDLIRGDFHFSETICEQDRERVSGAIEEVFRTGYGEVEFGMETADGIIIPYFATGRLAVLGDRQYLIGVGFDITERVASEAERTLLQEQLQQSTKMEAVGQLAGGVAHDFNNLLTVIAGNIELAQNELGVDNPSQHHLERVQIAATSAANLTRQLLAFSRRQIIEPRPINLNDLVITTNNLLDRLIGEHIEVSTVLAPDHTTVNVDRSQFEQILINLAVNARDAMPDGGQLKISTANIDLPTEDGTLPADLQPGPFVLLTMSDTGHGMSEEVKRHVFEPFFTTKATGRGTGLGLATIFGSVKQAGGAIDVQSQVGRGAMFRIFLPRHHSPPESALHVNAEPGKRQGEETVLLVEDDLSVRELIDRFLRHLGYTVLQASSGEEALAQFQQHEGPIDLLLTDIVMPGLSGRETSESLAVLQPDLKVLYMSGYTDDSVLRQRVVKEDLDFIAKPFDLKMLAVKLRDVLDRRID